MVKLLQGRVGSARLRDRQALVGFIANKLPIVCFISVFTAFHWITCEDAGIRNSKHDFVVVDRTK